MLSLRENARSLKKRFNKAVSFFIFTSDAAEEGTFPASRKKAGTDNELKIDGYEKIVFDSKSACHVFDSVL